jgi:hypothetical protein
MAVKKDGVEKRSVSFLLGMNTLILGANLVWVSYNTILLPTDQAIMLNTQGIVK